MNKDFQAQYSNEITAITDGLTHKMAIMILTAKEKQGLISHATLVGYRDCVAGIYDKIWRYGRAAHQEPQYLQGVQAAINNGAHIEQYIEVAC